MIAKALTEIRVTKSRPVSGGPPVHLVVSRPTMRIGPPAQLQGGRQKRRETPGCAQQHDGGKKGHFLTITRNTLRQRRRESIGETTIMMKLEGRGRVFGVNQSVHRPIRQCPDLIPNHLWLREVTWVSGSDIAARFRNQVSE